MEIINYCIAFIIGVFFVLIIFFIDAIIKDKKPKNKVHFYVARDESGCLYLYLGKPKRVDLSFIPCKDGYCFVDIRNFRKYGLNPYDFKDLKWEDEPVEVFLNMKD